MQKGKRGYFYRCDDCAHTINSQQPVPISRVKAPDSEPMLLAFRLPDEHTYWPVGEQCGSSIGAGKCSHPTRIQDRTDGRLLLFAIVETCSPSGNAYGHFRMGCSRLGTAMKTVPLYQLVAFSIDFEGSIGISRGKGRYGGTSYQLNVNVANTSKAVLIAFQRVVGFGNVTPNPYYTSEDRAPCYYWKMSALDIREHLPEIEPYLTIKRKQAQLLIEAFDCLKLRHDPGQRTTREYYKTQQLEQICEKLMELNKAPCYKQQLTDAEKFLIQLRKR